MIILYNVDVGMSLGLMDKLFKLNEKQCWKRLLSVTSSCCRPLSCVFNWTFSRLSSWTWVAHSSSIIRCLARLLRTDSLFRSRNRLYSLLPPTATPPALLAPELLAFSSELSDVVASSGVLFIDFCMRNVFCGWKNDSHSVFNFKLVLLYLHTQKKFIIYFNDSVNIKQSMLETNLLPFLRWLNSKFRSLITIITMNSEYNNKEIKNLK